MALWAMGSEPPLNIELYELCSSVLLGYTDHTVATLAVFLKDQYT
jgi:hypothetical protein